MDVATSLILAIMFALPTVFMLMGFSFNKGKAVTCLGAATVLWLVLVPTFPVISQLDYTYLSYVFFVPAIISLVFMLTPSIEMWKISNREDWENDED